MSTHQTEAFVVHLFDYGETSKIIQILTAHHGKLSCIVKGLKRKNNPWIFTLDRLNRIDVQYTWKPTREVQIITDVVLLDGYPEIKNDIHKQILASIVLETAFNFVEIEQNAVTTYHQVYTAFEHIKLDTDNPVTLTFLTCWHLWQILVHSGLEPQLDCCIRCGKSLPSSPYFSWQGGTVCPNCHPDYRLQKSDLELLQQLKQIENPLTTTLDFDKDSYFNRILSILCKYISFHSGHALKSYNVLREIINSNLKGTKNES